MEINKFLLTFLAVPGIIFGLAFVIWSVNSFFISILRITDNTKWASEEYRERYRTRPSDYAKVVLLPIVWGLVAAFFNVLLT